MGLKDRISNWREGESEARKKRERKRRQRAREDAAAAEQKALAGRAAKATESPSAEPRSREAKRPASSKPVAPSRATKASGKIAAKSSGKTSAKSSDESASKAPGRGKRPAPESKRTASADARRLGAGAASVGVEVAKLAREMLVIPLQLWLAAAEFVGKGVLWAWLRVVLPVLRAVGRVSVRCLHFAERHVTPARAVAATVLVAIAALGASQWLDYRSVSVGADAYSGTVGIVAPAPEVDTEIAGSAHSWVMLPLAVAALVALVLALAGRRRAALGLVGVGVAVIVISLAVDAPRGLDEGETAIAYEGASASLLEGFWMQIATGAVLIACGLLLPYYLRPAPAGAAARRPTGPTPAAVIASRTKDALGRVRVPQPKLGRRGEGKRRVPSRGSPKRKPAEGAGT